MRRNKPRVQDLNRDTQGNLPAWAFPGGYPIVYLDGHNDTLCNECATSALDDPDEYDDWKPADWFIYHEGPAIECRECGEHIESAYGEVE